MQLQNVYVAANSLIGPSLDGQSQARHKIGVVLLSASNLKVISLKISTRQKLYFTLHIAILPPKHLEVPYCDVCMDWI